MISWRWGRRDAAAGVLLESSGKKLENGFGGMKGEVKSAVSLPASLTEVYRCFQSLLEGLLQIF